MTKARSVKRTVWRTVCPYGTCSDMAESDWRTQRPYATAKHACLDRKRMVFESLDLDLDHGPGADAQQNAVSSQQIATKLAGAAGRTPVDMTCTPVHHEKVPERR